MTEQFASFRTLYRRIPADFYEKAAFFLTGAMILLLFFELVSQFFFHIFLFRVWLVVLGGLAEGLGLLWLGKKLFLPEEKGALTLCDMALGAMLLWSILSTVLSPDPAYCFIGSNYRVEGLSTYLIYASFFLCCRMIRDPGRITELLWLFCGTGSVLALVTLLQTFPFFLAFLEYCGMNTGYLQTGNLNCIYENTNHFAYLLTMVLMAAGGLCLTGSRRSQILGLVLFGLNLFTLIKNNTLGCFLAVGCGLLFLGVLTLIRGEGLVRRWLPLFGVFAAITLLSQIADPTLFLSTQSALDVLQGEAVEELSVGPRLQMWAESLALILQRPLLGYGPEGSGVIFLGIGLDRPHNEYIQYALYLGIPGAALYLTALISLLVRCLGSLKRLPLEGLILGGMVFAYCVSAFVGNSMYNTTIYFFCFLGMLAGIRARAR